MVMDFLDFFRGRGRGLKHTRESLASQTFVFFWKSSKSLEFVCRAPVGCVDYNIIFLFIILCIIHKKVDGYIKCLVQ